MSSQEYFNIPLSNLKSVLSAAHITTVRLILQYYSRNKDSLQVNIHQKHLPFFPFFLHGILCPSYITQDRILADTDLLSASVVQLPKQYLSTMVSVLFQTHLAKDGSLFPELAPLLAAATPSDIQALPSLQNNVNV